MDEEGALRGAAPAGLEIRTQEVAGWDELGDCD